MLFHLEWKRGIDRWSLSILRDYVPCKPGISLCVTEYVLLAAEGGDIIPEKAFLQEKGNSEVR